MRNRPEPVAALLHIAKDAKDETEYKVTFRAWHLRSIAEYVQRLEGQNSKDTSTLQYEALPAQETDNDK